jgi:hypothetical protein
VATDLLERWVALEWHLREATIPRLVVVPSRRGDAGSVVVTAPHARPHLRDGERKRADRWTGSLALLLAERTGVAAVIETSGDGDPAWDREHPFKDVVASLAPTTVLDLHAMRAATPTVEVGSGEAHGRPPGPCATAVVDALTAYGIDTVVDHRFPARGPGTLTQWGRRRGLHAVQLEVSVRLVPPFATADQADSLLRGLGDAIRRSAALPATGAQAAPS